MVADEPDAPDGHARQDPGAPEAAPEPEAPGEAPRRLVRHPTRGPVAGVSEGLGQHFGVDPVVFRITFAALALFMFPLGFVLYGICWVAIPPAEGEPSARADAVSPTRTRTWLGVALLIVGGVWLLSQVAVVPAAGVFGLDPVGAALTSGNVVLALLLLAGGVGLLAIDRRSPSEELAGPGAGGPPPAPSASAAATTPATHPASTGPVSGPTGSGAAPAAPPPGDARPADAGDGRPGGPPPPRSRLGRITAGVLMVVLGGAWLLHALDVVDVGAVEVLALALLVLGAGLVVGGWWGRSRGLIGWGIAVTIALILASVVQVGLREADVVVAGGLGERTWTPDTAAEVEPSYELGMGEATLDLSETAFDGGDVDVSANVGLGELTIYVPDDVDVTVDGTVRVGDLRLFDVTASGAGTINRTITDTVDDPQATLDIDAGVGLGELVVQRQ